MYKIILIIFMITITTGCTSLGFRCDTLPKGSVEQQECLAIGGNKNAQYVMGAVAYDAGDTKTALRWLKMAAQPIPSKIPIYSPPVGNETIGTVMMLDNGIGEAGHPKAQLLIDKINNN